ncbi:hypothetical protein BDV96DRAFT_647049 [Lophiotrema nucula]|uniref:Actin-like ATPase domain-containing protein n=1 Tax=Lophiotrema nucula TaxID=690887 RepID=A0A6A5Z7J1_9PLEO|nr:hypothetical protein BDV96DRAFT_647049 [Lophiotrema nucula]
MSTRISRGKQRAITMADALSQPRASSSESLNDFIVGIDFGTTRSNASFIRYRRDSGGPLPIDIQDVDRRVKSSGGLDRRQIPTEILFCSCGAHLFGEKAARHSGQLCGNCRRQRIFINLFKPADGYQQAGKWSQQSTFKALKKVGIIEKEQDVIELFFEYLFEEIKRELGNDYTRKSRVSFRICCPVQWKPQDRRQLKESVTVAASRTGFGTLREVTVGHFVQEDGQTRFRLTKRHELVDMQLITEPEAACINFIANPPDYRVLNELRGSMIMMFDVGGGTLDIATYLTTDDEVPSLSRQLCQTSGGPYGAQTLNDALRKLAHKRLDGDVRLRRTLESLGITVDEMIETHVVRKFEDLQKGEVEFRKTQSGFKAQSACHFQVDYLTPADDNGCIQPRWFTVTVEELWTDVYKDWYQEIARCLREQIGRALRARQHNGTIHIVPYGGGAYQMGLQEYLEDQVLAGFNGTSPGLLRFIRPNNSQFSPTIVSRGATLSWVMGLSPDRMAEGSYGIIQHLPVGGKGALTVKEAEKRGKVVKGDFGGRWLEDTINYFMEKGQTYPADHEFDTIELIHDFANDPADCDEPWEALDILVYRDGDATSGFPKSHSHNAGYRLSHTIINDLKPYKKKAIKRKEVTVDKEVFGVESSIRCDFKTRITPRMRGLDLVLQFELLDANKISATPTLLQTFQMDVSEMFPLQTLSSSREPLGLEQHYNDEVLSNATDQRSYTPASDPNHTIVNPPTWTAVSIIANAPSSETLARAGLSALQSITGSNRSTRKGGLQELDTPQSSKFSHDSPKANSAYTTPSSTNASSAQRRGTSRQESLKKRKRNQFDENERPYARHYRSTTNLV